jgi:uncharacterized protein
VIGALPHAAKRTASAQHHRLPLAPHWGQIRQTLLAAQHDAVQCAIATIAPDGAPHITPMGTVFLHEDVRNGFGGYFFDTYTSALGRHLDADPRVCVMAVRTSRWFWLKSFVTGRFATPPGLRLHGRAGPLREATPDELAAVAARTRSTRRFKGHQLLWTSFTHVRELRFEAVSPVVYPVMMDGLWAAGATP